MRLWYFPLAVALALAVACSSQAAKKPRPKQVIQTQSKKVWTNDEIRQVRDRGGADWWA